MIRVLHGLGEALGAADIQGEKIGWPEVCDAGFATFE